MLVLKTNIPYVRDLLLFPARVGSQALNPNIVNKHLTLKTGTKMMAEPKISVMIRWVKMQMLFENHHR